MICHSKGRDYFPYHKINFDKKGAFWVMGSAEKISGKSCLYCSCHYLVSKMRTLIMIFVVFDCSLVILAMLLRYY